LLTEVKTRVDAVTSFPVDAERPIVAERAWRHHMLVVSLAGDIGEENLKILGEDLRDQMSELRDVSVVELKSPRDYEVSIEVSEFNLRRYGLRFDDVIQAIRDSSLNLPAGLIRAEAGDIQIQSRGQAYDYADFENIVLVKKSDGTRVMLRDVATIIDGFADQDVHSRFNSEPSLSLTAYVSTHPNVLKTSEAVRDFVDSAQQQLPPGVELTIWRDSAVSFKGRIETLLRNGIGGLILVFLVLVLFLRPKLAMWVSVGIGIAFFGALWILQYTPVGLNMISLFAFLLILGIVVDDAIIVGESIHRYQVEGYTGKEGAVAGTNNVIKPVVYAVISTMVFFVPMFFMPGDSAKAAMSIPVVVLLALAFSLIESLFILPAHLAHMKPAVPSKNQFLRRLEEVRSGCAEGLLNFARSRYRPFLKRCLSMNGLTVSIFVVAFIMSLALYGGGWIRTGFFPNVTSDRIVTSVTLPEGGPFSDAVKLANHIETAAAQLKEKYNQLEPIIGHVNSQVRDNTVLVTLAVDSSELSMTDLSDHWRELIGDVGNVEDFKIDYTINNKGKPIKFVLAAASVDTLRAVNDELGELLAGYPGVFNVQDTLQSPRQEIELSLKPEAENLSITLADLASQVRRGFHGAEVQRIPRDEEDVKVMVRYPKSERTSIDHLYNMRIRTRDGLEVPFSTLAEVKFVPGYMRINRLDRKRTVEITANLEPGTSSPKMITQSILRDYVPQWKLQYPAFSLEIDGEVEEESDFLSAMLRFMFLAMLVIYGLMAIPFRSYWQPLLILSAIPFGVMGGIIGHFLLGLQISIFSLMGVIACAGVVVNDNLVLIDRINQLRGEGKDVATALLQGAEDRFRPIILTSMTTFIGLLPIMAETSVQAQFLIPMVTSLAFGVLLATGVTLILVPSLYFVGERIRARVLGETSPLLSRAEPFS
jgi:multidrug efflux pump subunit AcrB